MGKRCLPRAALGGFVAGVVAAILLASSPAAAPADDNQKPPPLRTGEKAILAALNEPTHLEFVDTPLGDMIDYLARLHRIQILLDTRTLDDIGVDAQTPITRSLAGIKLRSALELILSDLDLTWTIHAEVLFITTPEVAGMMMATRVYDVGDLVIREDEDGHAAEDYDPLIEAIMSTIQPETWDDVGGPGSIAGNTLGAGLGSPESDPFMASTGSIAGNTLGAAWVLVVRQTLTVHEEVDRLLAGIRAAGKPEQEAKSPSEQPHTPEEAIRAALREKVACDFVDTPLQDVVDFFKEKHGIEIQLDTSALDDMGIDSQEPVNLHVADITLRSALELMLGRLELAWTIHDEVLLITAPEEVECMLETRVYRVGDLVVCRDEQGKPWDDYDALIDMVDSTVAPDSWDDVGGPGSIVGDTFANAKILVIRQTEEIHRQVAGLLASLRAVAATHEGEPPLRPRVPRQDEGSFAPADGAR